MQPSPTRRRSPRPSRAALVVASLAAAAALLVSVAITGLGSTSVVDAAGTAQQAPAAVDHATGERVVVETVYVVTADPAPLAAAPAGGEVDHEGDDHEGDDEQHEHEAGDD